MTLPDDTVATIRTSGTNLSKAKSHNFSVILEVIRTRGPISRTVIADITSLSRQTVQNIVAELDEAGLIKLSPSEIRGRGHPGMEVTLNPAGALSMGIHVDRHVLTAVACDLTGAMVWSDTQALAQDTVAAANHSILEAVKRFRAQMPEISERLLGLCVAAPGPFGSPAPGQKDITSFQEIGEEANVALLVKQTGLPIVLENDATAAAVGEWLYGVGKGTSNLAVLHFGMGLGAGFILGGAPYRGRNNNAGEIGHLVVEAGGRPCFCGNAGCLEQYLSMNSLYRHLDLPPNEQTSIDRIIALCNAKDTKMLAWLSGASAYLRQAINAIEVMLDPDTIAIGGLAPDALLDQLIAMATPLLQQVSPAPPALPRIQRGASGPLTVALGAAAVAIDTHFAPSASRLVL